MTSLTLGDSGNTLTIAAVDTLTGGSLADLVTYSTMVTGGIVNLGGDSYRVNTNMFDPDELESVDAKKVKSIEPSKVSMMPEGLVNMLKQDEILDLLAYILSGGSADAASFKHAP